MQSRSAVTIVSTCEGPVLGGAKTKKPSSSEEPESLE